MPRSASWPTKPEARAKQMLLTISAKLWSVRTLPVRSRLRLGTAMLEQHAIAAHTNSNGNVPRVPCTLGAFAQPFGHSQNFHSEAESMPQQSWLMNSSLGCKRWPHNLDGVIV